MLCRHLLRASLLALALLTFSSPAHGQRMEDGSVAFYESKAVRGSRALRSAIIQGKAVFDPKDKDHKEAIEIAGKELVYPLAWETDRGFNPGKINDAVRDVVSRLETMSSAKRRDASVALQPLLCKHIIDCCKEVTEKGKPIAGINAAMVLNAIVDRRHERRDNNPIPAQEWADEVQPRLVDGNGELLANTILALLSDKALNDSKTGKIKDATRYYLFRTLANLLGVPLKTPALKKETAEKIVLAAIQFVETPTKMARNAPRDEVEGYKALRREAIKVIAQAPSAAIADKGLAALILGRFAANDERVVPAPRTDERIEAAIGLCRLISEPKKSPGFELDYAAAAVARSIHFFGLESNSNINKVGLERVRPWKVDAARLADAIEVMRGDGKNPYIAAAAKKCLELLTPVTTGNQTNAGDLGQWLERTPPASKSMYRAVTDATVKPAGVATTGE